MIYKNIFLIYNYRKGGVDMKKEILPIRISADMKNRLKEEADKKGVSSSALIMLLITKFFEKGEL